MSEFISNVRSDAFLDYNFIEFCGIPGTDTMDGRAFVYFYKIISMLFLVYFKYPFHFDLQQNFWLKNHTFVNLIISIFFFENPFNLSDTP